MTSPAGQVYPITDVGVVAVTVEGGSEIVVLDADTLEPIAGSPFSTAYGPVAMAHDDFLDRLYVHCIATAGVPEESAVTVFDTSTAPWTEVAGSPFDIDVPAFRVAVDPVTGNLYGVSLSTFWGVEVGAEGFTHLPGSPGSFDDGGGSGLAVDPELRRLYFAERIFGMTQRLHALDLDTFAPAAGSPIDFGSGSAGDVVVNPLTGDIFMIDYASSRLLRATGSPFALGDACGSAEGCAIPDTETGLALDWERDRLFIPHLRDTENPDTVTGRLTVWDVSDPSAPTEVTDSSSRPELGYYPIWAAVY